MLKTYRERSNAMGSKEFNLKKEAEDVIKKNSFCDTLNEFSAMRAPFFFCVAVTDDGKKTEYKTRYMSPQCLEVSLTEDRFPQILNALNGFNTIPGDFDPRKLSINELVEVDKEAKNPAEKGFDLSVHPEIMSDDEYEDFYDDGAIESKKKAGDKPDLIVNESEILPQDEELGKEHLNTEIAPSQSDIIEVTLADAKNNVAPALTEMYNEIAMRHQHIQKGNGSFIIEEQNEDFDPK